MCLNWVRQKKTKLGHELEWELGLKNSLNKREGVKTRRKHKESDFHENVHPCW